jgi:chromosomal replication initiation ATPase DnaA
VKGDERILGGSDFVEEILSFSGEHYEPRYDLVRRGYDLDRIVNRVAEILEMELHEILSKGRKNKEVVAGSLQCFWAARELGLSFTELARQLEMTVAGIGYAVCRGEKIARENHYRVLKDVS